MHHSLIDKITTWKTDYFVGWALPTTCLLRRCKISVINISLASLQEGFPAGEANGHHLVNRSLVVGVYLEVGDGLRPTVGHRAPNDIVTYPDQKGLITQPSPDGTFREFTYQDGTLT